MAVDSLCTLKGKEKRKRKGKKKAVLGLNLGP